MWKTKKGAFPECALVRGKPRLQANPSAKAPGEGRLRRRSMGPKQPGSLDLEPARRQRSPAPVPPTTCTPKPQPTASHSFHAHPLRIERAGHRCCLSQQHRTVERFVSPASPNKAHRKSRCLPMATPSISGNALVKVPPQRIAVEVATQLRIASPGEERIYGSCRFDALPS